MAVNLIRKNNGAGITAFQDSVLFHLSKGVNGVIKDVHNEFSTIYNNTTKKLIVSSGMGIAYGRQFEIKPGENVEFDLTSLGTATKYISIYAEIDLRDPTDEVVSFKATYSDSAYPQITEGDNLISTPNGLYRMHLFHVLKNSSNATITPRYNLLLSDTIDHARLAEEAEHALDASTINGVFIQKNGTTNKIEVVDGTKTDIVERKRLLFSADTHANAKRSKNQTITLSEAIAEGDILEVHYRSRYDYAYTEFQIERKKVDEYWDFENVNTVFNDGALGISFQYHRHRFAYSSNILTLSISYFIPINFSYFSSENVNKLSGELEATDIDIYVYRIYKIIGGN